MIICSLEWKNLRLREVTQLINGEALNQIQSLWLPNLHYFHYLMLHQMMDCEGRTMFKRQNETVLWTENVERVKCYGGQKWIVSR